ncbi:MAG: ComEC/Rec2 family competence protein [Kiritimatiellae bacterium]|nr:ComEC/Rec2 family competence protein [Kiritimatiellia bacterium]
MQTEPRPDEAARGPFGPARRRPLAAPCVAFVLGAALGVRLHPALPGWPWWCAALLLAAVAARLRRAAAFAPAAFALAVALGRGATRERGRTVAFFRELVESNEECVLRGTVATEPTVAALPHGGARLRFDLRVAEVPFEWDSIPVPGAASVRVDWYGPVAMGSEKPPFPVPRAGEGWQVAGTLSEIATRASSPLLVLRKQAKDPATRALPRLDAGPARRWLWAVRRAASKALARGVGEGTQSVAIVRAMTLGIRGEIPREAEDCFRASGTIHVFAISGMHVMVVFAVIRLLLRLAPLPRFRAWGRWAAWALAGAALVFYVSLTGGRPSAVRACTMTLLYTAASAADRRPDSLGALLAAAALILAADPMQILDLGFLFSFSCVGGILLVLPFVRHARRRLAARFAARGAAPDARRPLRRGWRRLAWRGAGWLLGTCEVSLVAWLVSAPLTAVCFGRLSPVAILCNVPVIPLAGGVVWLAAASLGCACVLPPAVPLLNRATGFLADLMVRCAEAAASIPGAAWDVEPWPSAAAALWYAALAVPLLAWRAAVRRRADASKFPA